MAQNIQTNGWTWETIWPPVWAQGAGGQMAILAGLYAMFGADPTLILPINAVLHASSGLLIYLIVQLLCPGQTGRIAGTIAAVLFVVFPSSLNWYAQIHKDGFAIAGTLLVLYVWLLFYSREIGLRSILIFLGGSIAGALLILFVRPYSIIFLIVATALWILLALLFTGIKSSWRSRGYYFIVTILVWTLFLSIGVNSSPTSYAVWSGDSKLDDPRLNAPTVENRAVPDVPRLNVPTVENRVVPDVPEICTKWNWQPGSVLPGLVEKYAELAARSRSGLICANYYAPSTIDRERLPNNVTDIILYMPRSIALALLGPFPDKWFSPLSLTRMVGAFELLIWYLCIPGVFLALLYRRSEGLVLGMVFALCYLAIYGFTIANLGTLHRVRYPFLMYFTAVGVLGWVSFLDRKGIVEKSINFLRPKEELVLSEAFPENKIKPGRKRVVGLGIYVSALTFLGFVGFFYRDVLMAQSFGLGSELDGFFVALLIPMTIVTIICIPLGAAFTPHFLSAIEMEQHNDVKKLISSLSAVTLAVLIFLCLLLFLSVQHLLPYVTVGNRENDVDRIYQLTMLALPILLFSGPVIVGNAVLNALGKVVKTGVAQLVVPVVAIIAVVLLSDSYGVQAVMIGMITGQLLNLLILEVSVRRYGYTLLPRYDARSRASLNQLALQYFPLIASAFFVSVAILVNTLLAMSFPAGGASVFNLGNKIVLLMTGLIGAAISTVMLPYFSAMVARNHIIAARKELSVFLLLLTFFTIPVCIVLFVWSEQIVGMVFEGGNFGDADASLVSRVMKYAVVQIPFFACNVLLLKFATATRHVMAILLVAVLGLLINVAASLFFMSHMGVPGIALGASLSIVISTIFLVFILFRYRHIGLLDTVTLMLSWMLFITLLISLQFDSMPGTILTVFTYLVLMAAYAGQLFRDDVVAEQV